MNKQTPAHDAEFDAYADNYQEALNTGLALSGEDSVFFARSRVEWLTRRLRQLSVSPRTVLDFGCGTGSTVQFLSKIPGVHRVVGTDESGASLERARESCSELPVDFIELSKLPESTVDLAYCNGVFHHISPSERATAIAAVRRALRPDGLFAFWENNPWNPGTRLIMRRIPFDRDAEMLSSRQARRLLTQSGFDIVRNDFAFIFPNALRALRPVERFFTRVPVGGQYMVLARKAG